MFGSMVCDCLGSFGSSTDTELTGAAHSFFADVSRANAGFLLDNGSIFEIGPTSKIGTADDTGFSLD